MHTEEIDELAMIAYETYEQSLHCRSNWDGLYPTYKDAWRKTVSEIMSRKSFDNRMDLTWCQWVVEAATNDKSLQPYSKTTIMTERDRQSDDWEKLFAIHMTSAIEHTNRLINAGNRLVRLTWKLGSK